MGPDKDIKVAGPGCRLTEADGPRESLFPYCEREHLDAADDVVQIALLLGTVPGLAVLGGVLDPFHDCSQGWMDLSQNNPPRPDPWQLQWPRGCGPGG